MNKKEPRESQEVFTEVRPLSRTEMHESAKKRVELITNEFTNGFEFLEDHPKSVTVFGSSRTEPGEIYYEKAVELGKKIANELGYSVITGGGPGIMEAINRGAFEARGNSVGITIKLPNEQKTNGYLTDQIALTYFFTRKVFLSFSAEAYIFFPGGYGTLDEFFEIITLVQTKKIEPVPIILYGSDYWRPLEKFIKETLLAEKYIDSDDMALFKIEDNDDKVIEIIRKSPVRNGIEYKHENERAIKEEM